jgi:hypothetical protein
MRVLKQRLALALAAAGAVLAAAGATQSLAAEATFIIRNGATSSPGIQANNDYVAGGTEFIISEGSQKAAWGTDGLDGATIGQMSATVTRHDDTSRFASGSGPAVAPYFNIWVTNGAGQYAVLANEPSNPEFQPLFTDNGDGSKTYSLSISNLGNQVAKVFETPGAGTNTDWVHQLFGSGPLTFADVASLQIAAPPPAYIANPANAVGSGAPDEIGTNAAFGFNWVFGDTLSNYVSGAEGYVVSSMAVQVVPLPAAAWAGLAMMGLLVGARSWKGRRRSLTAESL